MMQASPGHAMWLIARLRLRRLFNMVSGFKFKWQKKEKSRAATPAKKRIGWVMSTLVIACMLFTVLNMGRQAALNVQCYLEPASKCVSVDAKRQEHTDFDVAASELHAAPFGPPVMLALSMQLSLLFLCSILLPLSSREIAAADWDLEWLVTLPARRSTLLWGRILERTLANPTGWILLVPCCGMLAWFSGFGWSAPLIGALSALALLPLAAMVRTLIDTGMRMSFAPSQLRNVQAVTTLIGMPLMYVALAFATMHTGSPILNLVAYFPAWAQWLPPGLLLYAINASSSAQALGWLALLALETVVPIWAGMRLLRYQLRNGVVASGARESGRRTRTAGMPASGGKRAFAFLIPQSPIKRRELRLLARDRNFLIQSVLLPLVIVLGQLIVTNSPTALADMGSSPKFMAGLAFGIGSYMLMLSAFQTLNNEGQSLWMLYTFPQSIENVLKEKAQFWGVLALLYPVLISTAVLWFAPTAAASTLGRFAVVLAGVPIFSSIAVALGVFGCDPLAQDARTKIRPSYMYLYMMLSGLYVYGIATADWLTTMALVILMASLALALWQKARDQLPYLLDPSASPPARVSTADGLIAAMLFFVLQGAILLALVKVVKVAAGEAMVIAFAVSGVLVYAIMRLVYWLTKSTGVPAMLRKNAGQALAWGVGGGFVAAAMGLGYLGSIQHWGWFPQALVAGAKLKLALPWLFFLAVVAAPLCEEFIFRGLIFGGLRRSMGLMPSMVMSAALFAIVHPPVSMLPVFGLGLVTAFVYDRSKALLAPVLVHAVYNGVVLGYQLIG